MVWLAGARPPFRLPDSGQHPRGEILNTVERLTGAGDMRGRDVVDSDKWDVIDSDKRDVSDSDKWDVMDSDERRRRGEQQVRSGVATRIERLLKSLSEELNLIFLLKLQIGNSRTYMQTLVT